MTLIAHSPGSIFAATVLTGLAAALQSPVLMVLSLAVWAFLLVFFRGFSGSVNWMPNVVVSPCDGVVISAHRYRGNRLRICVALHLLDRHVQIAPVDGHVLWQTYKQGEFNPVFFSQKTHLNERMETAFQSSAVGTVVLVQIAGQVARRIVSFVEQGQEVEKGQQVGLIKFGSRCDLDLPSGGRLLVSPGDKVKLGQDLVVY